MNVKRLRRYVGRRCLVGVPGGRDDYVGTLAAAEGDVIELENVEVVTGSRDPRPIGGTVAVVVGPGMTVQVV